MPGGRLPDEVRPPGYQIDLVIDPRSEHFSGGTRIEIEFLREIVVTGSHGRELRISVGTFNPPEHLAPVSRIGERFCTPGQAASMQAFLGPRAEAFAGDGRRLAKSVEAVELCAARAAIYRAQLFAYVDNSPTGTS